MVCTLAWESRYTASRGVRPSMYTCRYREECRSRLITVTSAIAACVLDLAKRPGLQRIQRAGSRHWTQLWCWTDWQMGQLGIPFQCHAVLLERHRGSQIGATLTDEARLCMHPLLADQLPLWQPGCHER